MHASLPSRVTAATLFLVLAVIAGRRAFDAPAGPVASSPDKLTPASAQWRVTEDSGAALLYGRVTTIDGEAYVGRMRFGGTEEALWSNYFNGFKTENPWAAHVPRRTVEFLGIEVGSREVQVDERRPFMVRFGDISRIEPTLREIHVTLKSGSVHVLDRFEADDLADGVRIWDERRGVTDIGEWTIRSIEFTSTPQPTFATAPLYGTVRTRIGTFTGLVQWDRERCLVTDEIVGYTADGERGIPFVHIRSISRRTADSARITLRDGVDVVLSNSSHTGHGHRGIYVDDVRFGRVLVSWDAFERADFEPAARVQGYDEYPAGRPLTGSVTTRSGHRLTGRLVYDLDESETTETLDAPTGGVDFTIPFGLVASIVPAERSAVVLHSGLELRLESAGDLGRRNAGVLVFTGDRE